MHHSLYLKIASLFVLADLKSQQRKWHQRSQRLSFHAPYASKHLLKDIGLEESGFANAVKVATIQQAKRRVKLLRYLMRSRLAT